MKHALTAPFFSHAIRIYGCCCLCMLVFLVQANPPEWALKATLLLNTKPDSAFLVVQKGLDDAILAKDRVAEAYAYQMMGIIFFNQGVYPQSLEHLLSAERIMLELGDESIMGENLNQQGLVYYAVKQPDLAMEHHREALDFYTARGEGNGIAYSLGCIGRLYEKSGDYEQALAFQQRALQQYAQVANVAGKAEILENIASIYEDQENFVEAMAYYQQSLELTRATGDSLLVIVNLNNVGDIYRKTNDLGRALDFYAQALALAERMNDRNQVRSTYADLAKTHAQLGNYQLAYEYMDLARNLYKEIFDQESNRQLTMFQTLFDLERKNNEIIRLRGAKQLDLLIQVALGGGLLMVGLLGFLIVSRQRLKIRADKSLMNERQAAFEAQQRLMEAELENIQLREKQLQDQLDGNAKSLTAHTLHVIGKNNILEEIREKLKDIREANPQQTRKKVGNLIKMIDRNFVQDKDWDDFRHIFEQVHQDFFDALQSRSDSLTPADLRLAALIRMHMPSKDIVTLLGVTTDSLRVARYRLKKKLNLSAEDSLGTFIRSI